MGKVHKKGALTNYVLITGFKKEFEKVDKVCTIYIEAESVQDFITTLSRVTGELERISASIQEDTITILTSIDPQVFKMIDCKLFVHYLDRDLYLRESDQGKRINITLI